MADAAPGWERLAAAFARPATALMPYMMAGYPDLVTSRRVARAYVDGGADIVELGVPFSDPLADGPVIQAAGQRALEEGTTVADALALGGTIAAEVPVVCMCYENVVRARGIERFVADLAAAGYCGLLVPDEPIEQSAATRAACDAAGIALVGLVAPTTPPDRLALIASAARGFVYVVSVTGVTGERTGLPPDLPAVVAEVRRHTDLPVAVGFGIATPDDAARVAEVADGVIIGSRLVREVGAADDGAADAARSFLADVRARLDLAGDPGRAPAGAA